MSSIRDQITRQARRRRNVLGEEFEIRIDGISVGSLEGSDAAVRLPLPAEADLIEVYGHDREGDVLVATHLLHHTEDGRPTESSGTVRLGRKCTFAFDVGVAETSSHSAVFCSVRHARLGWLPWTKQGYFARRPLLWAAAAALVLLALGSAIVVQNQGLRWELAQIRAAQANLQDRERSLQEQIAQLEAGARPGTPSAEPSASTAPLRPAPETVIARTLAPVGLRTGGQTRQKPVVVSSSARTLLLNLLLKRLSDRPEYAATIETVDGSVLRRLTGLRRSTSPEGQEMVTLRTPAQGFTTDDYVIRLRAPKPDGTTEPVDDYSLQMVISR